MNQPATPGQVFAVLVILGLFVASVVMLVRTLIRVSRGETLVPYEERDRPGFGLTEIVVTVLLYLGLNLAAYGVLTKWFNAPLGGPQAVLSPDQFLLIVIVNSLATALAGFFLMFLVASRRGTSVADLGITTLHARSDIALGTGAFLLMAGLVYLLQSILFSLFPQQHPLLELISENPQPQYFAGAFLSAAVIAPIFEELFFRAAIQGWLEKFFLYQTEQPVSDDQSAMTNPFSDFDDGIIDAQPATPAATSASVVDNPYAAPQHAWESESTAKLVSSTPEKIVWAPIVISSLLFALAHFGQGPAPIPLFFLALCLGYLYQKTHRLLPCITVHALLNTTSIVMLWLSVGA